ncbi:MAG: efflux RND transporter periplasmic adaptor subunit [Gemmatimonadaceae bacterium]
MSALVMTYRRSALLLLFLACGRGDEPESEAAVQPEVTVGVGVAAVGSFREVVTAIGTVAARPGHVAALGAPASARVARVLVAVGDRVKAGATLIEFEQAPFAASLRSAEAQLTAAQNARDRAQRLVQEGIMSRRELELAESELEQARANVVVAKRASDLSVLQAPFAGVVTRMDAVLSSTVEANQALVEVADPSVLDVVLRVSPGDAARLRSGASVTLTSGEGGSGESLGTLAIADIGGAVDTATRAVIVRARGGGLKRPLRIGETVYGAIAVGTRAHAVTVPASALVPEGDGYRVFVVDTSNVAHVQEVSVGARADSVVEILEGLKGGERIVTYGAFGVSDSSKVVQVKK